MFNVATNKNTKKNISIPKDSMKHVIAMCLFLAVLIFGRAANNTMFYVFAVVCLVVFLFSSVSLCFSLLLFLLPFAKILKIEIEDISFFTFLFFFFVLKMVVVKKTIQANLLVAVMLFAVYGLSVSGLGELTTVITMASGMMMLYYLQTADVDIESAVIAFALGIVLSSVLVLLKSFFPIVNAAVVDSIIKFNGEQLAIRFSGLQGNPNYYTMDITMALSVLIILLYRKTNVVINTVFFATLSVFGLMSVSKSFLVCWVLLIIFWFGFAVRRGIGKLMKFLIIVLICGAVIYLYAFDSINTYVFRFFVAGGGTLADLTTGRTDIWQRYISAIFGDIKIIFFGNGLNTVFENMKGTHNTYLEALFSLGIVGSGLFLFAMKTCARKMVSRPIMLIPVCILLVRMVAINMLTYDNLWLYFAVIVCMSRYIEKTDNEAKRKLEQAHPRNTPEM